MSGRRGEVGGGIEDDETTRVRRRSGVRWYRCCHRVARRVHGTSSPCLLPATCPSDTAAVASSPWWIAFADPRCPALVSRRGLLGSDESLHPVTALKRGFFSRVFRRPPHDGANSGVGPLPLDYLLLWCPLSPLGEGSSVTALL